MRIVRSVVSRKRLRIVSRIIVVRSDVSSIVVTWRRLRIGNRRKNVIR